MAFISINTARVLSCFSLPRTFHYVESTVWNTETQLLAYNS